MCHLFIILEVLHAQEKMAKMALQKYVVGDHFKQICWERGASICFWKNWEVLGLLEWLSLGPQKFRPVMPLPPWPQQFTFWGEQTLQPDAVSLSILLATEELPETSRRCSPFSSDSTTQGLCLSSSKKAQGLFKPARCKWNKESCSCRNNQTFNSFFHVQATFQQSFALLGRSWIPDLAEKVEVAEPRQLLLLVRIECWVSCPTEKHLVQVKCLRLSSEILMSILEAQELEGHGSLRSRFAAAASRHWDRTDRSCEITLCEALCGLAWLSDSFWGVSVQQVLLIETLVAGANHLSLIMLIS